MIQYPKRLIEVDLPLKKISEHARREKSIRQGHISSLHIWWARRPLAACRAVLCAALWPDPADPLCPEEFKVQAANVMKNFFDPLNFENRDFNDPLELRKSLLDFIADFANWDNSTKKEYFETSCILTQRAHEVLGGFPETKPLVVDPFAGGGSIPLEALRVGADTFASDLNPISVILNKVTLEYIPRYGKVLTEEISRWGKEIEKEAKVYLADYYPKDFDGSIPVAYLWTRTIKCEGPNCGAEVPIIRSLWLAKKEKNPIVLKIVPDTTKKYIDFEIIENADPKIVTNGTVKRGNVTCPICGFTTQTSSVKKQLKTRRGGTYDARLFCVVITKPGKSGKYYRLPNDNDLEAVRRANEELQRCKELHDGKLSLIPDEPYPDETASGALSSSVSYGIKTWGDLYTPRQALTIITFLRLINKAYEKISSECEDNLSVAILTFLALALDKTADRSSSLCRWIKQNENIGYTFGRQSLPMMWDFVEAPIITSGGGWSSIISDFIKIIQCQRTNNTLGNSELSTATNQLLPTASAKCIFTDPPYYDAIAYGDLSDFFYVWLKRILKDSYPSLFSGILVNKNEEIVQLSKRYRGPYAHKTKEYFEKGMEDAMRESCRVLAPDGIGIVVFAHKSTSGWEAQLQAMINAGWTITGSWPLDTERPGRMNSHETAALASSVHLVCRPLQENKIGDWRDVLYELPQRIHEWMPRLRDEGVVGADAIFSCIGPALEIYSRYSRVEKASGEEVTLREYLEHVWGAVSREALNMIFEGGDATGFEEDARLTAMWLWTLKTEIRGHESSKNEEGDEDEEKSSAKKSGNSGLFVLEYDTTRKIAQGLGAHMEQMPWLVKIEGSSARLLSAEERIKHLFQSDVEKIPKGGNKGKEKAKQTTLFNDFEGIVNQYVGAGEIKVISTGKTALDKVHQAMLLFAAGSGDTLKRFLVEEEVGRDDRFWRLAQALSALYPAVSNEKRWIDGVLARKKGLGC